MNLIPFIYLYIDTGVLYIETDVPFKYCEQVADLLCDNGYEVIEVRRTDGDAANIITVACKKTDIETIFFNDFHYKQYLSLQIDENHKDMNDHLIISQAISDKITLISSDSKFPFYEKQKLKFVFNKR